MKKLHYIFQASACYLAWICGIELAAKGFCWISVLVVLGISALQIIWQFTIMKRTKGLFVMALLFTLIGFIVDSLFQHFNLLHYTADPFRPNFSPPWMIALWFNFAVFFYSAVERLFHRYRLLGVLSLIAFPISYLSGKEWGIVHFPHGLLSILYIGMVWAFLFPLCLYFYNSWMKK